jgi:HAD superfamily hydrolase (TIGR01549 family)
MKFKMKALFWDFDGTLVDSRRKNYQVTKKLITTSTDKDLSKISFLKSFESYKEGITQYSNWRDIYQTGFGLNAEETDLIGSLWTEFQLNDNTPVPIFEGIEDIFKMYGDDTNVIISQNSRENIIQILEENKISSFFDMIVGFEEVDIRKQKPDPTAFIYCIENLSLINDYTIFYIGDHETDIKFARNTSESLKSNHSTTIIKSIGVFYGNDQSVFDWSIKPDFVANSPPDIIHVIDSG